MEQLTFYVLGLVAIVGAFVTIFARNAMYSVLALVTTFFAIAGIYLQLNAEFVAVVHIIVYAGAIMVLFLFVVMMLNLNNLPVFSNNRTIRTLAALMGFVIAGILIYGVSTTPLPAEATGVSQAGTVKVLGKMLFNEYLLPFELTSVLLIATMVGVIVLTKKEE